MDALFTSETNKYDTTMMGNIYAGTSNEVPEMTDIEFTGVSPLHFRKISHSDMPLIMSYFNRQTARTTDFSLGGILMWVDVFNYEFCIYEDTLFIKGVVEDDFSKPAFSIPLGRMSMRQCVRLLKEYCREQGITLEFSAVPVTALEELKALKPSQITELEDWADYLYDAEALAYLKGKKLSKKRNHVNRFMADYHDHQLVEMNPSNAVMALEFMNEYDKEGDDTPMAIIERRQTRCLIQEFIANPDGMFGAMLMVAGKVVAFTLADIVGDTLFIHVEKALREVNGSYEAINTLFARHMLTLHPELRYINREDDSGDPGLRKAKESYHPLTKLRKYNVIF